MLHACRVEVRDGLEDPLGLCLRVGDDRPPQQVFEFVERGRDVALGVHALRVSLLLQLLEQLGPAPFEHLGRREFEVGAADEAALDESLHEDLFDFGPDPHALVDPVLEQLDVEVCSQVPVTAGSDAFLVCDAFLESCVSGFVVLYLTQFLDGLVRQALVCFQVGYYGVQICDVLEQSFRMLHRGRLLQSAHGELGHLLPELGLMAFLPWLGLQELLEPSLFFEVGECLFFWFWCLFFCLDSLFISLFN